MKGRRDDLESLGYVLLYFLRGSLPWQGLHATDKKHKYDLISEKKTATPLEEIVSSESQQPDLDPHLSKPPNPESNPHRHPNSGGKELCRNLPLEFVAYLNYVRSLR